MQVFLIRHADGRDRAVALAERLRWHDCHPTRILASPAGALMARTVAEGVESVVPIEIASDDELAAAAGAWLGPSIEVVLVVASADALARIADVVVIEGSPCGRLDAAEAARIVDGRVKWRFACDGDAPVIARLS